MFVDKLVKAYQRILKDISYCAQTCGGSSRKGRPAAARPYIHLAHLIRYRYHLPVKTWTITGIALLRRTEI